MRIKKIFTKLGIDPDNYTTESEDLDEENYMIELENLDNMDPFNT